MYVAGAGATATSIDFKSASGQTYSTTVSSSGEITVPPLPPTSYTTIVHYTVSETSVPLSFTETCPGTSFDLTNNGGGSAVEAIQCTSYPTVIVYGTATTTSFGTTASAIAFGPTGAINGGSCSNCAGVSTQGYFIAALQNNAVYPVTIVYTSALGTSSCSAGTLNLNPYTSAVDYEFYSC